MYEIETALGLSKPIQLMHETDGRHGAFDFGSDEVSEAPPFVAELLRPDRDGVCAAMRAEGGARALVERLLPAWGDVEAALSLVAKTRWRE